MQNFYEFLEKFNEDRLRDDYYDNMLLNDIYDNDNADDQTPPSTSDVNLYDLMGDDYYPYLIKDAKKNYTLTIEDFEDNVIAEATQINPCAIDGFAEFCRRYLASYDRLNQK
jgi:hypothetical protein